MPDVALEQYLLHKDPLKGALVYDKEQVNSVESIECLSNLDSTNGYVMRGAAFKRLDKPSTWEKPKTSIEKALVLDLKLVLSPVWYTYLGLEMSIGSKRTEIVDLVQGVDGETDGPSGVRQPIEVASWLQ
ncbi:hypothetical protein HAX54_028717 [Datura stramonium]|uniref:Uncharacterized protein n=1 Tax=Datura stramonium TaxID=4076 RepID=A0ABS8V6Q7_DATST|nr:hypothetical protein [Datura stramonium]